MQGSSLEKRKKVAIVEYDFDKDGGAVGDISLRGESLQAGAIVDYVLVDVLNGLTSSGAATVALKLVNPGDVKAAGTLTSYTAGIKAAVPDKTAANSIKTTARTKVVMTIAVADLTGGKFRGVLEYFVTEPEYGATLRKLWHRMCDDHKSTGKCTENAYESD